MQYFKWANNLDLKFVHCVVSEMTGNKLLVLICLFFCFLFIFIYFFIYFSFRSFGVSLKTPPLLRLTGWYLHLPLRKLQLNFINSLPRYILSPDIPNHPSFLLLPTRSQPICTRHHLQVIRCIIIKHNNSSSNNHHPTQHITSG